jgi:hypothetical protein
MNTEQALKITVDTLKLDSLLTGEPVNLNRVTFWLSELSYGRKHVGASWSHAVPRDIVQTAAKITEGHYSPAELVKLAS